MAIQSEKDLPQESRNLWLKAIAAVGVRNYGYAISLIQAVLKQAPDFLEGRKMLRRSEVLNTKGKKSFFSGISTLGMKGPGLLKKDPHAAVELAEKELENDPYNLQANHLLKDAAKALNMPETAAFALETLVEGHPKDTKIMHELGAYFYELGEGEKAAVVYSKINEINPADLQALKLGKDAAAKATMKGGGWEEVASSGGAKDYRSLIKDKDTAISLEQQGRVVKSEEMIDQQLGELWERYQQEPENVDVSRKTASLYEQKGDLENAIAWYSLANNLGGGADLALARKVSDLTMKSYDAKIAEYETWLASYPDQEESPRVQADLDAMKKAKATMLIDAAKRRVERNPTDLQFRFELGEQLFNAGEYTEAIQELQRAKQNPNVRIKAITLLGQCFEHKNMLDLAKKTLEDAVAELLVMDATKKELVYRLGIIYEKLGDKEASLNAMKQIYEVDYGYADVAQRVESSYAS